MSPLLLELAINAEPDVVLVRRRSRELAALLGFELADQTRIATAASEVGRNAFQYAGGGTVRFSVDVEGRSAFVVRISDTGPGIANLAAILGGRVKSRTGLGMGLIGSKKLMDDVRIDSVVGEGTTIEMRKALPEHAAAVTPERLALIEAELSRPGAESPFEEVRRQNQELIRTLNDLKAHQVELARMNEVLQGRVEFERHLVGIVSHDLRNPIGAILLSAGLLVRRGDMDERQTTTVARITSSGYRAERMIGDLLDFTQARIGGGIPVHRTPTDLHAVTRQIVDELRAAHPLREVRFEPSGDGGGAWDPDRIAQVLTNLVRNALRYSPAGTPVLVTSLGTGDSVVLEVHNQGTPIPPETGAVLFEPMRRGTGPLNKGTDGLGLGLFIVKQIVLAHEGSVDFRSSQAEGTTFTVTLPRHALSNEAKAPTRDAPFLEA